MKWWQRVGLMLVDGMFLLSAAFLALLLRFEGAGLPQRFLHDPGNPLFYPVFYGLHALIGLVVFTLFGLYDKMWRYAGVYELVTISVAATVAFVPLTAMTYLSGGAAYPRAAVFIAWMLTLALVGGTRFLLRLTHEGPQLTGSNGKRALIVGANDQGELALREMRRHPELGYAPVCFVDEDPARRGITIHGVPVLGAKADLPRLVEERRIQEVIVALPMPALVQEIVALCAPLKVPVRVIPSLSAIMDGTISMSQIRAVEIEDLLEREPVRPDVASMASYVSGKTVLVTGAGGSIGSEICRQLAGLSPARLILMGRGENSVYEIALELGATNAVSLVRFIGDMRDRSRMETLFREYRPQVVFHAAAHKHVSLMEENPVEAVSNNVLGTRILADAAVAHGVERFVFLSTDKAVNPTSVMGASKRLAEMVLMSRAAAHGPVFAAVRFGNVLDSRGSVIPTFRRQIALGGPVTVTDPEMTRFFMTIPEAVHLVIQAGALGRTGDIFILDMGRQVKILDLARNLIRLSGFEPDKDIPIVFTGMRPGEKVQEELMNVGETTEPTAAEKIVRLTANPSLDGLEEGLNRLADRVAAGDEPGVLSGLREMVKNFHPGNGRAGGAA